MDSISIKVPVTVKAKLTEKLRAKMLKEMEEGLSRAELELQQLGIQEKRVMQEAEQGELTPQAIQNINNIRQERSAASTTSRRRALIRRSCRSSLKERRLCRGHLNVKSKPRSATICVS